MERVKLLAVFALLASMLGGCAVYTVAPARPAYVTPAPGAYYAVPAYRHYYPYRVWH